MSKYLVTSLLGLAVAAFAATGAQAAVHGVFGDGYSAHQHAQTARSNKPYAVKSKRRGKHVSSRRGSKSHSSHSRRSSGKRHAHSHSHGGGGVSRACLQSSARALLSRIESQFGPVQIVSTCRPGAVIAGSGKPSKHRYGLAVDFNAPSGKKGAIVQWLIKNHHSGGTMTYAGMNHIHVDVGPRFVSLGAGGRRRG
jgi:uncharacterized protein YcbK (DUF882 family)